MFLSQQVKQNAIIINKSFKYVLTDELPNDVSVKETSNLHGIIV